MPHLARVKRGASSGDSMVGEMARMLKDIDMFVVSSGMYFETTEAMISV